jgi:YidC/Oxa1 family membrane protein insertase
VIRYYSEAFAFSPSFLIWQDLSVGGFSQNILLVLIDILAVAYTSLISSTDMRSARQSVIMGVIFPFLFITFPTGLFLYYTVGSIIQLGITYYVYKKYNIKGISLKEFFGLSK